MSEAPGRYTYEYPRPALAVDAVVFGFGSRGLEILLIQRGEEPFKGHWAFPGGFVHMDEDLEPAVRRELAEETGIERIYLEQLQAFGAPDRDPRGRVVSVAWYGLVRPSEHAIRADTDAHDVGWFPADTPPDLAFDHAEVLEVALERVRLRVRHQPIGFELLDETFTISQFRRLYEAVLNRPLDKRNFRRKLNDMGLLIDTGTREQDVPRRPAALYRFDRARYEDLVNRGFHFEL